MPHTYTMNLVHCVFSTKNRAGLISEDKRPKLWAYTFGISKNIGVELLAIGGTADHIHLLIVLPSDKKLAEVVRDLKANSSRWDERNDGRILLAGGVWRLQREPIQRGNR